MAHPPSNVWLPLGALLVTLALPGCLGAPGEEEDQAADALSTGTGLQADYFAGTNFEQRVVRRVDPGINFIWKSAPWSGVPFGNFSVRWQGEVEALQSGTYTFSTTADDGVRLWVDGLELVDDWTRHAARQSSGSVKLKAGSRYPLKMEYFNSGGETAAKLFWQFQGGPREIIPAKQLYPGAVATYGTLMGDDSHAARNVAIGAATTEFVIKWNDYEPKLGQFNANYRDGLKKQLATLLAAGVKPTLSFSLHYLTEDKWICSVSGASFVDSNGTKSCGKPFNLVFSQPVRDQVVRAIRQINTDFGLSHFAAIRVQTGGLNGEISYPTGGVGYWAFDANASKGGKDLPKSLTPRPNPSWHPGQKASHAEVAAWADWYVSALADAVNFQIDEYVALGFRGKFIPVMPGKGVLPTSYDSAVAANLPAHHLLGQGVAWWQLFGKLHHRSQLIAYTSSLAEGGQSEQPCTAADRDVQPRDSHLASFDVGRYMTWIGHYYGVRSGGENPGAGSTGYGVNMMKVALEQVRDCGMAYFYWAHEYTLYDGEKEHVQLQDYANFIRDQGGQYR